MSGLFRNLYDAATHNSLHLAILGPGTAAVTLGYEAVLLPGEFDFRNRQRWSAHGIGISLATWQIITELCSP
jgi:LDH2 family malate/lactate/ureidoglycolate dehydrogenase